MIQFTKPFYWFARKISRPWKFIKIKIIIIVIFKSRNRIIVKTAVFVIKWWIWIKQFFVIISVFNISHMIIIIIIFCFNYVLYFMFCRVCGRRIRVILTLILDLKFRIIICFLNKKIKKIDVSKIKKKQCQRRNSWLKLK